MNIQKAAEIKYVQPDEVASPKTFTAKDLVE